MIVCPLCEHPQAEGPECEVCGKRLVAGPSAADLAIRPVEGFEPTPLVAAGAPTPTAERLSELEPTLSPAAAPFDEAMPGLEATRAAPVDVDVTPAPDVERTANGIPGDAPTALPPVPVCRYCRTAAMPGERICARCGMRLPVLGASAEEATPAVRLCTCGTAVRGSSCPSCGARMA